MSKTVSSEVDLTGTPLDLPPGSKSVFGDFPQATVESWEGLEWRLAEVEAKVRLTDNLEDRVDAIISEVIAYQNSLSQQVAVLEKALGIVSTPKAQLSRSNFMTSGSTSKSRRDAHASSSPLLDGPLASSPLPEERATGTAAATMYGSPTAARSPAQAVAETVRHGLSATGTDESPLANAARASSDHIGGGSSINSNSNSSNHRIGSSSNVDLNNSNNYNNNNNLNNKSNSNTNSSDLNGASSKNGSTNWDEGATSTLEAHVERRLSPSVWNAAFFVGMNRTGFAASLSIILLLLINISMQGTFLLIINKIVSNQLFDNNQLETLRNWRLFVGQSVKYYDPLTQTSLTQRVCAAGSDVSRLPVDLSDSKAQLVEAIKDYLPTGEDFWSQLISGPSLSLIALAFWTLKVIAELLDILDTAVGILSVPLGKRNIVVENDHGNFRFASFVGKQRIVFVVTLLVRSMVCILLWVLGCNFLMNYSIEPAELILNAVALEIVLNVDEVLYTLVPASCKHLMNHLEPLPGPKTLRQWRGLDGRSACLIVLLITTVFLYYDFAIVALMDRVELAHDAMCEGKRNVIFATDPYQFVYTAGLEENDGSKDHVNSGADTAIMELVYPELIPLRDSNGLQGHYALGFPQSVRRNPASYLQQVSVMTNAEAATNLQENQLGTVCSDGIGDGAIYMGAFMADYGVEVETCADVRHLCNEVLATRTVCPEECGCDTPFGDVFDMDPSGGCPELCTKVGRWDSELASHPCKDMTLDQLESHSWWWLWVQEVEKLATEVSTGYEEVKYLICKEFEGDCTQMLAIGCDFVPVWNERVLRYFGSEHNPDACTGRFFGTALPVMWRPLAPICPEACGCIENPDRTTYISESVTIKICPQTCSADDSVDNASENATNDSGS